MDLTAAAQSEDQIPVIADNVPDRLQKCRHGND